MALAGSMARKQWIRVLLKNSYMKFLSPMQRLKALSDSANKFKVERARNPRFKFTIIDASTKFSLDKRNETEQYTEQ